MVYERREIKIGGRDRDVICFGGGIGNKTSRRDHNLAQVTRHPGLQRHQKVLSALETGLIDAPV